MGMYLCDHCCAWLDAEWYPENSEGVCPTCVESESEARMTTHRQWLSNFKPVPEDPK